MTVLGPAATVADATRLAAENSPDLAILDVNLQGELTYDLIDQLFACDVPVIIVSGYELLPAAADKASAVLKKPIRAGVLLTTVKRVLEARNAQR